MIMFIREYICVIVGMVIGGLLESIRRSFKKKTVGTLFIGKPKDENILWINTDMSVDQISKYNNCLLDVKDVRDEK